MIFPKKIKLKVLDIYVKSNLSLKGNFICYNKTLGQKYLNIIKDYLDKN